MKKILNEGIRFSVFCLKEQKSNKEGNKNKIASNTDIVLYFHFFVVLILIVPFCRDTTPPSRMSSDTKAVAFRCLQKCDDQAGGHGGGEKKLRNISGFMFTRLLLTITRTKEACCAMAP